jgi:hypothetical protein
MTISRRSFLCGGLAAGTLPLLGPMTEATAFVRSDTATKSADDMGMALLDLMSPIFAQGPIGFDVDDMGEMLKYPGECLLLHGSGSGENALAEIMSQLIARHRSSGCFSNARGAVLVFTGPPEVSLGELAEAIQLAENEMRDDASILFQLIRNCPESQNGPFHMPPAPGESRVTLLLTGICAA